ncbi:MAG: TolC family protein [Deltaproteobacteria bacterium]|nr:TolC family protein [Deltaproteobacteria bacterium]
MRRVYWLGLTSVLGLGLAPSAHAQEAEAPPKVSFEEAVKRALAKNPQVKSAMGDVRRSEALVEQARGAWLPVLNANATFTRLDNDRELNGRVILSADQLNANLTLGVPIIASRAWAAHARAKENVDVAKMSYEEARRQVVLATGRAFLTVVAQHRVLETALRARDVAKAHEEFAKSRLSGGVGNRLDAVRAAQERATSETRVRNQRIALVRAQEALGVMAAESGPIDAQEDASMATAPPTLATALAQAETRADVLAQRDRVTTAHKAVRDSYTDYLPILSGNAQGFYQNPATFTVPQTGWQVQLLLTLPLFDGGVRYGVAHERESLESQAKARLEGTLRQARSEVRVAFEAMRNADEAMLQAKEAAALAKEALELAQLAYRSGATSNIEVVDAERRAADAETDAAVAEDAARQARLDLVVAAGKVQ